MEVNHKAGYANVTDGIEIVAQMFNKGNGSVYVKLLSSGRDLTATNEHEAMMLIRQEVADEKHIRQSWTSL